MKLKLVMAVLVLLTGGAGQIAAQQKGSNPLVYVVNLDTDVTELRASDNVVFARAIYRHGSNGGIVITPDGQRMYVSNHEVSSLTVYDTATNVPLGEIQVGANPIGLAITKDGSHIYVANQNSNTVSVIATATNTVVATIPVGFGPIWVTLSPDNSRAYVSNQDEGTLSIVSTAGNSVLNTVLIGSLPFHSAFAKDGRSLWVSIQGEQVVRVFNTATGEIVKDIPVGPIPRAIAFTPDGTRAYVSNFGANTVSVLDAIGGTFLESLTVGASPWGMAMTPQGVAYVANFGDGTVSAIDTTTNNVTSLVLHRQAVDVAVTTRAKPEVLGYRFTYFDYPGAVETRCWAINDLGTVVGDYTDTSGVQHGYFRTANGTSTRVDVTGATLTQVTGLNNYGVLAGNYLDANGLAHGFKQAPNGTVTTVDYPGALESVASDINNLGTIVGGYGDNFTTTGFSLQHGTFRSLEDPDAAPMQTNPFDINDRGVISGYFFDPAGMSHSFLFDGANYQTVDFPMAANTADGKLNNLGQLVGIYSSNGPNHGYLFDSIDNTYLSFDVPDVAATQAHAINNKGQIAGNYKPFPDTSPRHGFIATPLKSTD